MNLCPLKWKHGVLTTGPPGKPPRSQLPFKFKTLCCSLSEGGAALTSHLLSSSHPGCPSTAVRWLGSGSEGSSASPDVRVPQQVHLCWVYSSSRMTMSGEQEQHPLYLHFHGAWPRWSMLSDCPGGSMNEWMDERIHQLMNSGGRIRARGAFTLIKTSVPWVLSPGPGLSWSSHRPQGTSPVLVLSPTRFKCHQNQQGCPSQEVSGTHPQLLGSLYIFSWALLEEDPARGSCLLLGYYPEREPQSPLLNGAKEVWGAWQWGGRKWG